MNNNNNNHEYHFRGDLKNYSIKHVVEVYHVDGYTLRWLFNRPLKKFHIYEEEKMIRNYDPIRVYTQKSR